MPRKNEPEQTIKVLLREDEPREKLVETSWLEEVAGDLKLKIELRTCSTAAEAQQTLRDFRPDAALVDMQEPGERELIVTGYKTAEAVRASNAECVVLFKTNNATLHTELVGRGERVFIIGGGRTLGEFLADGLRSFTGKGGTEKGGSGGGAERSR